MATIGLIGQTKRILYQNGERIFVTIGKIISEDEHLLGIDDRKDGTTIIGKKFIVEIKEVRETN